MLWLYGTFKGAFSPRYCFLGQKGNVHCLSGRGGGGWLDLKGSMKKIFGFKGGFKKKIVGLKGGTQKMLQVLQ